MSTPDPAPHPIPHSAALGLGFGLDDRNGLDDLNLAHRTVPALIWALDPQAHARLHTHKGPRCDVIALWNCPICDTPVHTRPKPGRRRVYCTNACRQKAYRLRCAERRRVTIAQIADPQPRRATTRDKTHAIREFRDALTGRRDSTGRGVTACGLFARMSIDTPERFAHTRFSAATPARASTTCRRCETLSGLLRTHAASSRGTWAT